MMRFRSFASAAFFSVLLAISATGQDQKPASDASVQRANKLTIIITGGDQEKPVENASVYVKFSESRVLKDKKYELNVKSNREGVARIPDPPTGAVLIQVVAEGWKTYGKSFDITEANPVVRIHLDHPPKWY